MLAQERNLNQAFQILNTMYNPISKKYIVRPLQTNWVYIVKTWKSNSNNSEISNFLLMLKFYLIVMS